MEKQQIHNIELWRKFKLEKNKDDKNKIKQQLVEVYYPLVKSISYKVSEKLSWKVPPEELASFGVDGLYTAIDKFSTEEGVDFPAYANRRIGGSMIDGIRREDTVPRSVRINHNLIEKIRMDLETDKGRKITEFEIVEKIGIEQREFLKNTKKYKPVNFVSIEGSNICDSDKRNDFKQDSFTDIQDKKTAPPEKELIRKEFLNKLISKNFSRLEQQIVILYYRKSLTMGEIANKLKLSESRVSQIHSDLLPRLKNKIKRNPKFFKDEMEEYKNAF